jgi:hypothetical protein
LILISKLHEAEVNDMKTLYFLDKIGIIKAIVNTNFAFEKSLTQLVMIRLLIFLDYKLYQLTINNSLELNIYNTNT